jgi:hypothetical protein
MLLQGEDGQVVTPDGSPQGAWKGANRHKCPICKLMPSSSFQAMGKKLEKIRLLSSRTPVLEKNPFPTATGNLVQIVTTSPFDDKKYTQVAKDMGTGKHVSQLAAWAKTLSLFHYQRSNGECLRKFMAVKHQGSMLTMFSRNNHRVDLLKSRCNARLEDHCEDRSLADTAHLDWAELKRLFGSVGNEIQLAEQARYRKLHLSYLEDVYSNWNF